MQDLKDEVDTLTPKTTLFNDGDRRNFLKVALGTGFAAAVMPVTALPVVAPEVLTRVVAPPDPPKETAPPNGSEWLCPGSVTVDVADV